MLEVTTATLLAALALTPGNGPAPAPAPAPDTAPVVEVTEPAEPATVIEPDGTTGPDVMTTAFTLEVEGFGNEWLLRPDYHPGEAEDFFGIPMKVFDPLREVVGVPSGGSSGSPSFDPILRRYWWD